jgi:AAA domain
MKDRAAKAGVIKFLDIAGAAAAENNGDQAAEAPLRPMPSWIEYGDLEVDPEQYLIGEGFLEIGSFIMLIGQSYAGKSTLVAQLSMNLAAGRSWLFFRIARPLRIMVVQAEDTENKRRNMGQMYRRMGLTAEEIELAATNTAVLTIRDLQDAGAIAEIERHAEVFKPDVIVINPLTSYLAGGVYKDDLINTFLRVRLIPMLDRLGIGAIVVHHPPKPVGGPKEQKDLTAFELQYGGAGMAALTNAPRGNVFLTHIDGEVFKLSVGKGFDDLGTKESSVSLRRTRDEAGVWLWEKCDPEAAQEADQKKKERQGSPGATKFLAYDAVLKLLKVTSKYTDEEIWQLVKKHLDRGQNWAKAAIKQLYLEKKLAKSETKTPGKKGAHQVYYHLPTVLEPAAGLDGEEEEA